MPINAQRAKEALKDESNTSLIWGPSKSGKTHFAGTAGDRSLFISNGMGSSTFKSPNFKKLVNSNPLIVEVPFDELGNKERSISLIGEAVEFGLESPDVDTIIIDDASANTRSGMIRAMEYNQATDKSKTLTAGKKFDLYIPSVQDYGTEIEVTVQFYANVISDCKNAKKNFMLLAHERNVFKAASRIGEQPILIKQVPAFTGADKNPDRIPGLFDWVLHTEKTGGGDRIKFYVRTQGDENLLAEMRDANGLFPIRIENPNYLNMLKTVREFHARA